MSVAPIFAIKNLASSEVMEAKPWNTQITNMPRFEQKSDFVKWCQNINTQYMHFSGFEGINPNLRVCKSNPAHKMHALVVDYDSPVPDLETAQAMIERSCGEYRPNFISQTFSKGIRALFLFEAPVFCYNQKVMKAFLVKLSKELKVKRLFAGWDEVAYYNVAEYYALGNFWYKLEEKCLGTELLYYWMSQASEEADWEREAEVVPLDLVAKKVQELYPDRWKNPFVLGARGCRFWDPMADNDTAAIIRETGMQCFTGSKPFVTWREILGHAFLNEFQSNKMGAALRDFWFDGRQYWRRMDDQDNYRDFARVDAQLHLKTKYGLEAQVFKGDTSSEVDNALALIQDKKTVSGGIPIPHAPKGIIHFSGKAVINTCLTQAIQPVEEEINDWGQKFPWIAKFLDALFEPHEQKEYFLAWLKHFYTGAYRKRMTSGQALFIVGPAGQGKTFLSNFIIGKMLGGHSDASSFLMGETKFNKDLFEYAVWAIDDTLASSDHKKHSHYSSLIKKVQANTTFEYRAMFKDPITIPWKGRVIVTCNDDPESIRCLPDIEQSLIDKISIFRIGNKKKDFHKEMEEEVNKELPFFCKWLLNWEMPEEYAGDNRYGVVAYHEPSLLEMAQQGTRSNIFLELLSAFTTGYFEMHKDKEYWEGSSTDLIRSIKMDDSLKAISGEYSARSIGRNMAQLINLGYNITYKRSNNFRFWKIPKELERS